MIQEGIGNIGGQNPSSFKTLSFINLHVLIRKRRSDTEGMKIQKLKNENLSIFINMYVDPNKTSRDQTKKEQITKPLQWIEICLH